MTVINQTLNGIGFGKLIAEANMADDTLIWPSKLHHLCLTTSQRPKMIEWYRDTMGLTPEETVDGMTWMVANLLLQDGEAGGSVYWTRG